ncbi:PREDICTED: uncharacterized protein LOC109243137 [Nicotiana attenuata]|uniref:uncharacterized protein LOC109243137 n=1 Tax=Nicotiana attenuata TaxID=49451 RepID=UPI0009053ED7|nr:PREDICTED: uncharacterized protein LOC109243137 [Nicotiana attenuata]
MRLLMLQRKDLSLRHNFREGNQTAHLLAKDACKETFWQACKDIPKLHPAPPSFVIEQVAKDLDVGYLSKKSLDTMACNRLRLFRQQKTYTKQLVYHAVTISIL